jgi:hypothetical protein
MQSNNTDGLTAMFVLCCLYPRTLLGAASSVGHTICSIQSSIGTGPVASALKRHIRSAFYFSHWSRRTSALRSKQTKVIGNVSIVSLVLTDT